MRLTKTKQLLKKAKKLIPGASQTLSKGPSQFIQGVSPAFIEKGKGCYVWDVDGNKYIDYMMALGPLILGYSYPKVNNAVKKILGQGTIFTLPHRLEIELAELLCRLIPCAEMARFGKNASDATTGAVRLARAITGRDIVACCGYLGWQDWYIGTTSFRQGVPQTVQGLSKTFEYNKIETLEKIFTRYKNKVACVIMEPIGVIEPIAGFLQQVRELTHKNGALFIYDETVTGFRLALGGAQEYFKVIPDLACFGKAMANGFPISAVVGRKEIMEYFEKIFYSFTFGGEIVSIAASITTIKELKDKKVIPYLWKQGTKLKEGYNRIAKELTINQYTECLGLAPKNVIIFKNKKGQEDLKLKSLFQQECIKRGILFTGGHVVCYQHKDQEIDYTLKVYRQCLEILKMAIDKNKVTQLLEGKVISPVFRRP